MMTLSVLFFSFFPSSLGAAIAPMEKSIIWKAESFEQQGGGAFKAVGFRRGSWDVVHSCSGRDDAGDTADADPLAVALHGPRLVRLHAPLEVARHSPSSFQDGETAKERDRKKEWCRLDLKNKITYLVEGLLRVSMLEGDDVVHPHVLLHLVLLSMSHCALIL